MCNFAGGHYDGLFCENCIEFGPVLKEISFKGIPTFSSGLILFYEAEPFVQFL